MNKYQDDEILLSICITTLNRGVLLDQLLITLLKQIGNFEVIVVDGGSSDNTKDILEKFKSNHKNFYYYLTKESIGLDEGFDLAVRRAKGKYCWLLPDDDLIISNGIQRVLSELDENPDITLVNMSLWDFDFKYLLQKSFYEAKQVLSYDGVKIAEFFYSFGWCLSYCGSVIIRRSLWIGTETEKYYESYFLHASVVLENWQKLAIVKVIAEPIILYRSGNVSWNSNAFKIWYKLWPQTIWNSSLPHHVKHNITPREPWRRHLSLLKSRGRGEYDYKTMKNFIARNCLWYQKIIPFFISIIPVKILFFSIVLYLKILSRNDRFTLYEFRGR